MTKPHWSPSSLDMICRCGEAYRRRYIEREVVPPGVAATTGRSVHSGSELNFRQKIESHTDLPTSDIVDAAVAAFEAEVEKRGVTLTPEQSSRGARVIIAEGLDEVAELSKAHAEKQAPHHQPLVVEEPIRIELDGPRDVFGYVDLVSTPPEAPSPWVRVVDTKTTRKKKSQADVDNSTQLTFYAAAMTLLGVPVDEVCLDVLVLGKRGVTRQVLHSTRTQRDFDKLAQRVDMAQRAIEAGVFLPATPGSWWCSPTWCGYWQTCPYVEDRR